MIEVILSPDLKLAEKREKAKTSRLEHAKNFKVGDYVKAGKDGKPGILESINPNGFGSIRWDCGSVLSGVEMDRLVQARRNTMKISLDNGTTWIESDSIIVQAHAEDHVNDGADDVNLTFEFTKDGLNIHAATESSSSTENATFLEVASSVMNS